MGLEKWEPATGRGNLPLGNVNFDGALAYAQWAGGTLPSEAQWEYACRGGTETKLFFGDDQDEIFSYAWGADETLRIPRDVGTKLPNPWGLYDYYGSVWEWCIDVGTYPTNENAYPKTNPKIYNDKANINNNDQVLRGASTFETAYMLSSSVRAKNLRSRFHPGFGFRMIVSP